MYIVELLTVRNYFAKKFKECVLGRSKFCHYYSLLSAHSIYVWIVLVMNKRTCLAQSLLLPVKLCT
jgi:hypothetical protein